MVVDDLRHAVNLIIRGEDILASTGRQILLARELGQELEVVYFHHGLLLDPEGYKLSKRDGSPDIHARKLAGEAPGAVLGEAAWRAGLIQNRRPVAAEELSEIVFGTTSLDP